MACALLPLLSVMSSLNLSTKIGEATFFFIAGALLPAIWLAITIVYYRRTRTKWIFALTPCAFVYAIAALVLMLAVGIKPGRW